MKHSKGIVFKIFDKFRNPNPYTECGICYRWESYEIPDSLKKAIQLWHLRMEKTGGPEYNKDKLVAVIWFFLSTECRKWMIKNNIKSGRK